MLKNFYRLYLAILFSLFVLVVYFRVVLPELMNSNDFAFFVGASGIFLVPLLSIYVCYKAYRASIVESASQEAADPASPENN